MGFVNGINVLTIATTMSDALVGLLNPPNTSTSSNNRIECVSMQLMTTLGNAMNFFVKRVALWVSDSILSQSLPL